MGRIYEPQLVKNSTYLTFDLEPMSHLLPKGKRTVTTFSENRTKVSMIYMRNDRVTLMATVRVCPAKFGHILQVNCTLFSNSRWFYSGLMDLFPYLPKFPVKMSLACKKKFRNYRLLAMKKSIASQESDDVSFE